MAVQCTSNLPKDSEEIEKIDDSLDNSILVESKNIENEHQIVITPRKCSSKKYLFINRLLQWIPN